ncbi:MAG: low molecular weight protein-tyrosine-phosphatase [Longimicrobiales bacterium]
MSKQKENAGERVGVVFVCLGNICRSPLAEGVFRHLVKEHGLLHRFEIDSAGTSSYHEGDPPDARSAEVARRRGIELTGRARPLRRPDLERFDFIMVMDQENHAAVARLSAGRTLKGRLHLLREFDPDADGNLDVPDPYYGGASGFERVHDMVERACTQLLHTIREERGW